MIGGIRKIARCDYIGASQRISLTLKIDLKFFFILEDIVHGKI